MSIDPNIVQGAGGRLAAGGVFFLILRWQRWLDVSGRAGIRTRTQYRRIVMNFLGDISADPEWTGCRELLEVTEDDLVTYLEGVTARGGARNAAIRSLRSFFGWIAEHEDLNGEPLMERNPMRHIYARKVKYGPAPSLTPGELELALKAAELVDPRARWAIALQYHTACRVGSLLELMPRDIRVEPAGPRIYFREAKGDKPYAIALSAKGHEAALQLVALLDYKPKRVTSRRPTLVGVGYGAYENWIKKVEFASGVQLRSHLLRHTAITRLTEANVDVRTIVEVANWTDPSLLRRYASPSEPNLRAAVEVL